MPVSASTYRQGVGGYWVGNTRHADAHRLPILRSAGAVLIFSFCRVLYPRVALRISEIDSNSRQVAVQLLESFTEMFKIVVTHFKKKLPSFLADISELLLSETCLRKSSVFIYLRFCSWNRRERGHRGTAVASLVNRPFNTSRSSG